MAKPRAALTILPLFWPKMPPIGLGFLQGFLQKNGLGADILDLNNLFYNLADEGLKSQWLKSCNVELEENIFGVIQANYPQEFAAALDKLLSYESIGLSCFKSNLAATLEFGRLLKSKRKDIRIILGGPEIARLFFKGGGKFAAEILQLADFLVAGEGEAPLLDYLNGGNSRKVAEFEQLPDLEALDFPRYQGISISSYPKRESIPLQFSRGCVRKCGFCSERLLYKGFRTRTVESVIEEISYHRENNHTADFVFFDSLINADLGQLEALCDKIRKNFGSINWEAQIAVRRDMRQEIFEKMKASGCYNLFLGLESGSDRILKKMNKGFTSKDALDFFRRLNQAGLSFGISIITGFPGETEADFRESLDFVIRNRGLIPKIEQVNPFIYYDGTAADKKADYKLNPESLRRMETFVREIKDNNFKFTNAFLGNLIEKNAGV